MRRANQKLDIVGIVAFGTLGTWLLARTPEPLAQRVADRI
jgi:hypothetical protein